MSEYSEVYKADFRLTILEVLTAARSETSLPQLRGAIETVSTHRPSMDELSNEIVWLHERSLVRKTAIDEAVSGATITARGGDVARGRERVGGVAEGGRIENEPAK